MRRRRRESVPAACRPGRLHVAEISLSNAVPPHEDAPATGPGPPRIAPRAQRRRARRRREHSAADDHLADARRTPFPHDSHAPDAPRNATGSTPLRGFSAVPVRLRRRAGHERREAAARRRPRGRRRGAREREPGLSAHLARPVAGAPLRSTTRFFVSPVATTSAWRPPTARP